MELFVQALTWMKVAFGIGLVIFVHELGHYLAARLCGVRVETFSLGFGPRLLGWERGGTLYQLAAIPLGGYCRMAGEEYREGGRPPAADELPSKSVGQRFFIYSGGVIMNVVLALVLFPIIFWVGVPFTRPTVQVSEGGPAWKAGVPDHVEIVAIGDQEIHEFEAILTEVALADPGPITLTVRPRGAGGTELYQVTPERNETGGFRYIGVVPDCERDESGLPVLHVEEDSPASRAGLSSGARFLGVVGGEPGASPLRQLTLLADHEGPAQVRILDEEGERTVTLTPEVRETDVRLVGIAPLRNVVNNVRASAELERLALQEDDRLVSVQGTAILRAGDLERALAGAEGELSFVLERGGERRELQLPALPLERRRTLAQDIDLGYDNERVVPSEGDPADLAGMRIGDRILKVDGQPTPEWSDVQRLVQRAAAAKRAAEFEVQRPGPEGPVTARLEVEPKPLEKSDFGLRPRRDEYVYKATSAANAVQIGLRSCWRMLYQTYLTLQRMLFNEVSPKNVGGIITIGAVSYHVASLGWIKHLFFLCLLSINLAFVNVLPIPVLDGGHLAFLVVEKIKGTPVSRKTLEYSQMVGVVLLLTLMVYVTYNDLVRWVFDS